MALPRTLKFRSSDPQWFSDIKRWNNQLLSHLRTQSPAGDGRTISVHGNRISAIIADESFHVVHVVGAPLFGVRCGFALTPTGEHTPIDGDTPDVVQDIGDVPADPDDFSVYAHIDETSNLAGSIVFKADDTPASADITVVRLADVVANRIYQHQQGTIIIGGGTEVDGVSLDENDDGKAQLYNWDEASEDGTIFTTSLFPIKEDPGSAEDLLKYVTFEYLAAEVILAIDYAANFPVDQRSVDFATGLLELKGWEAETAEAVPPTFGDTLIPAKKSNGGGAYATDIVYYELQDLLDFGNFWERAGDETVNYGTAIGNGSAKVIDLTNSSLTGDWATDGDFNLSGAGKVYKAQGNAGVTGDGFTGGIKTSDTAMRAAIESQVQDVLAGVGGLL